MFEGLVRQLILGYLGQYIKDIHKEQLRITLWNEEVLLENVELILEAFDYLQLPFALKQGRVGRLSIRIPWKKLGWDPIIIILEDVLVSACQRDDKEWGMDAVERREFAGKRAKLAAAELAKLSRRVCGNQTGKSFISYITAKILDGIQVSIRNVHIIYHDLLSRSVHSVFGLKFTSLTVMKQNLVGFSTAKVRGGQVNKLVEVQGLEIYCRTFQGTLDLMSIDNFPGSENFEGSNKDIYMLAPIDVSVSLLVNRSGKLENDAPQYSVNVELTGLIMSLDEAQFRQILILCDYLSTCRLREKYGRYRPWWSPLPKKLKGWQTVWWQYAQQSVLSDVRKRLRKTSWKFLGERLNCRRRYVTLYKTKLQCLQQEQLVDEDTLQKLEQMEKESDIDDILSYRSAAERELQELLVNSSPASSGVNAANTAVDKLPRGWLNWLSRGMLGAGGTDDSSQFSGVVSDEVVKDIYEATMFHPVPSTNGDTTSNDEIYLSSIKLNIQQISATLRSMKFGRAIGELIFEGIFFECKIWEESAVINASVDSVQMLNPLSKQVTLLMRRDIFENNVPEIKDPSLCIQVDVSPINHEVSLKVILKPLEVTCHSDFLVNIMEFYNVLNSFEFQHERVLKSLNGIDDAKARFLSKAEYLLSNRKRVSWDVNIINIIMVIPWENGNSELHKMVLESGEISFVSKSERESFASDMDNQSYIPKHFLDPISAGGSIVEFQVQDLYDLFEVKVNGFEVKISVPYDPHSTVSIVERLSATVTMASCIVLDESILRAVEVYIMVPSLRTHFSPSIYGAILGLNGNLSTFLLDSTVNPLSTSGNGPTASMGFSFSVTANLESASFLVDLENDVEKSITLMLSLQGLDIRFCQVEFPECLIFTKALRIITCSEKSEDNHILCSSKNVLATHSEGMGVGISNQSDNCADKSTSADVFSFLHYKAYRKLDLICHTCTVSLNDVDLHCYPCITGLLIGFSDKISGLNDISHAVKVSSLTQPKNHPSVPHFQFQNFGFSNFIESGSYESESIPVGHFPFVTIYNTGALTNGDSSFIHGGSEWRKVLNLRNRKIGRTKVNTKPELEKLYAPSLDSKFGTDPLPSSLRETSVFGSNVKISSLRVYFHDSSCIIGTVTLPTSICSLSIQEDCMDILCSTEGLILSSSWWTQTLENFLWGPSSTNLSPILNVRVRKGESGSPKKSLFEINFSIQHVSCTLPPEFLAIIIGYFSLPDWNSSTKDQQDINNSGHMDTTSDIGILYKFELLDSALFIPVESIDSQFLKLEIPQLYCSFILNGDPYIVLQDIPSDCAVPVHRLSDRNHCLNIYGHDLSLSLMFLKNQTLDSVTFNQDAGRRNIPLIAPIYADLWIRIPNEYESSHVNTFDPTCIMARVSNCEVVAEGEHVLVACEALLNVMDRFASVDTESQRYTADVQQFLQLKKSIKDNNALPPDSPIATFTEIRCSFNSMSIKLYCTESELFASKIVAKAELQFLCSASFRNDKPLCLDCSFSSVALYSFLNSVMLAECTSPCSTSSVLDINFSVLSSGENEFCVSLSSLNIWLHLLDWSEVIGIIKLLAAKKYNNSVLNASTSSGLVDKFENGTVDVSEYAKNKKDDAVSLIVKLETIGITIHIPVSLTGEAIQESQDCNVEMINSSDIVEGNQFGCVSVTLLSRNSELVSCGKTARLKLNFEKASGTVELCKDKGLPSWPFFQLFQVTMEADICYDQIEDVTVEIQCDSFDVWLSHQIFYFWHCVLFEFPETGSSQFTFSTIDFKIQLRKLSLLLTDGKRSSNGPLLEILTRNLLLNGKVSENEMGGSVAGDLQVNYNNIHKVLWEPFLEPWKFYLSITRRQEKSALLNSEIMTDINLSSTTQLNLNLTESFIEVAFRAVDMISWGLMGLNILSESPRFSKTQISENVYTGRYAPYILQNLTSLPLMFHVCEGPITDSDFGVSALNGETLVEPGSSIPIYINETPEEQLFRYRPSHSSDRLSDKQFMEAAHRYIIIQLEGTSMPSAPISMDLVGLSYFEVDFSLTSNNLAVDNSGDTLKGNKNFKGNPRIDVNSGYVVPVVIDVSVQKYTKLVRLYSKVILFNATSIPFEVRFDIPFGLAPKILDPIYPGQEFPLPLHLAEAGRMRWRPLGNTYLWSEAYNVSNILSHENRIGFVRSFVCYPSHPSSDPFRCSLSVHEMCLPSIGKLKKGSSLSIDDSINLNKNKKRSVHLVTLCSPLLVKNFLPVALSLTIECGGVTRTALLSEVETSFFHIDSSHDLAVTINMDGFRPSILKFPRAETFVEIAKFSGTKFSLSETITFDSDSSGGPLYVTMEKVMDAFSGAREICIFVPYLLYNCTGFPLIVSSFDNETKERGCIVPSCYDLDEQDLLRGSKRKDGLSVLSSSSHRPQPDDDSIMNSSSMKNHIISTRDNVDSHLHMFFSKPLNMSGFSSTHRIHKENSDKYDSDAPKSLLYYSQQNSPPSSSSKINVKSPDFEAIDSKKVSACMYSPFPNSSASENMVRLSLCLPESCLWSSPIFLVPPTGSNSVLVPQPSNNSAAAAAYLLSVTSNTVAGLFSGKTRIITFQHRYVISNACSKDLCYKQKGTDVFFHLWIGQHSHIQWTDTTRELLVSIRFDEPGSQWSGCFLPEYLGDTQLKMRNYVSGALNMIRVEVQNADVSVKGERIVGSSHGNSGTNLILLSDDDAGFMPYRIDNFSKERLRIYQQRCETFDTVIHSYTSCPYAWDEPCYPHRLTVEVPGERVVGSYTLDDVKEYTPVYLPATSEKPERTLLVSVHAEGALKVLSIIDSSYHILNEKRGQRFPLSKEKRRHDQRKETSILYNETILIDIPFIGISVINSYPQELIFACAKNTKIGLVRSLDHQKFSLQISSLQIDNQLHSTPYPVILSFDCEQRINSVGRTKDDNSTNMRTESSWEPVFSLAASKWSNKDVTLVSFEYIILRVADFHLDLEQEVILSLSDFIKTVSSGFQGSVFPQTDSTLQPLFSDFGFVKVSSKSEAHDFVKTNGDQIYSVNVPMFIENHKSYQLLPSIVPIGAPWQKNYLLARKHKKIYVELFDLAPVKLTLSFSSSPWMLRNGVLTSGESLIHRGLMALADVEGAKIHLKQLVITHQLASWESLQDILIRHYSRQLLHEIYKVFGSAGVIGNPMGFARSVGLGIKDFLSVPARSVMKSPVGFITGMAQGTTSLVSNTVYAISDAATQFSRAAQKGIVALTFDDQAAANMEKQQKGVSSHSKGVINEFLEGLTGLLQSPIKGAEKHGLPGVLSGVALGVTGLVARPAASILEVTGKTAQSIRNRSKLHHQMGSHRFRVRLPRPLSSEFPLRPYSWEEAVGTSVLAQEAEEDTSNNKLKDELLVTCKSLKQGGKFVIITERLVLIVSCPSLVDLGTPVFRGVPADPEWVIETEIRMDSVIHADCDGEVVHIVGSSADMLSRQSHHQNQKRGGGGRGRRWSNSPATPIPLFQTNLEFLCKDEAGNFLQVLLSTIKKGKDRGWGSLHLLHQINLK